MSIASYQTLITSGFLLFYFISMTDIKPKDSEEVKPADSEDVDTPKVEPKDSPEVKPEDSPSEKEKTAKSLINTFQENIDKGTASKEEAPQWMQNDLKDKTIEEDKVGEREILKAELRDDIEFEQLQKTLPDDLTQEQADEMNKIVETEVKLGKTKTEAFHYAKYKSGIQTTHKVSEDEKFIRATSFPIITPRNPQKQKEKLVNSQADKDYLDMVKETQGVKIQV